MNIKPRWLIATTTLALGLSACGGSKAVTQEQVDDAMWSGCFVFGDSNGSMKDTWQKVHDKTEDPGLATAHECGVAATQLDHGWTFTMLNPEDHPGASAALRMFGSKTGCLTDVDYELIGHTRALDGRVESVNGKTSWTYHPDDGLNIICNV